MRELDNVLHASCPQYTPRPGGHVLAACPVFLAKPNPAFEQHLAPNPKLFCTFLLVIHYLALSHSYAPRAVLPP